MHMQLNAAAAKDVQSDVNINTNIAINANIKSSLFQNYDYSQINKKITIKEIFVAYST